MYLNVKEDKYESTIRQLIDFFVKYSDGYHHHKEELLLFPEMGHKNELLQNGILLEMFENHDDFRSMVKDIRQSLDSKSYMNVQKLIEKYTSALLDHIAVENDEVFQMAEVLFTAAELEKMYFDFMDVDSNLGTSEKRAWEDNISELKKEIYLACNVD